MLSGETTTGLYPLECVEVMKNIVQDHRADRDARDERGDRAQGAEGQDAPLGGRAGSGTRGFGHRGVHAQRIPGLYASGARTVGVPIYAFTDDEALFRQLLLPWGVEPFLMPFSDDPEQTIRDALAYLKRREWCEKGTGWSSSPTRWRGTR